MIKKKKAVVIGSVGSSITEMKSFVTDQNVLKEYDILLWPGEFMKKIGKNIKGSTVSLSEIQKEFIKAIYDSETIIAFPKIYKTDESTFFQFGESTSYEVELAKYLKKKILVKFPDRKNPITYEYSRRKHLI